ncbi:hypothetical protein [Pseudoxanthomonas sp.]|uniref:hypothetical protein n=1 Tax=Pseudoxanthomonas sp. TaxID=1871049 RepID=UPI0025897CCE|nr:hypothetical protein [Pseudoxanthomonas sp.]MCR6685155.1 hypothetical protein [Pseudoxanthomonas sp.]
MPFPPEVSPPSPYAAPQASPAVALPAGAPAPVAVHLANLRTLSTLVFVFAAMCVLGLAFTGLILAVGTLQEAAEGFSDPDAVFAYAFFGTAFVAQAVLVVLLAWTGLCLRTPRRHGLCVATAAVTCLAFPLGTALGVALLVVLNRPGVRELFDARGAAGA